MHFNQVFAPLAVSLLSLHPGVSAKSCHSSSAACVTATKADPPNHPECAIYGKPSRGLQHTTCETTTFARCRDACLDDDSCKSFGWTAETGSCVFSKRSLKHHEIKKPNTDFGSTYFSRHCFKRSCFKSCATSESSLQMVHNPTFKDDFTHWSISSNGAHDPEIGELFGPNDNPQAYWISTDGDAMGVSASVSQTLHRNGSRPQPFKFSAWFGQYSNGGYAPMSVKVKLDDQVIWDTDQICTVDTVCQSFGDDTTYRQISAKGVMMSADPLLTIHFKPTKIVQYQAGFVNAIKVKTEQCKDED